MIFYSNTVHLGLGWCGHTVTLNYCLIEKNVLNITNLEEYYYLPESIPSITTLF